MNSCEGRACYETRKKASVRSQSISVESERGASHFRLSEGSNCLQAGRTRGFCFLHSERQGQEHRRLRAGEGSRGRTSGNRRFLWGRVLDRTAAASVDRHRRGALDGAGVFDADTILAKHDETYMPKEVADALKKTGHWKDDYGKAAMPVAGAGR